MKRGLKFLNAGFFLAAFGISFLDLVGLAVVNASLIDLIKLGFGKADGSVYVCQIIEVVQDSVRPMAFLAIGIVVLMWVGILLSLLLPKNAAYYAGIILAVLQALGIGTLFWGINSKLEGFREGLEFFGLGEQVQMYLPTLLLWIVVYIMILFLSVVGICLKENKQVVNPGPIMEEQFHSGKNPWEPQKNVNGIGMEQAYFDRIEKQEQERKQYEKKQQEQDQERKVHQVAEIRKFTGAVVGLTGQYASMAYSLQERQPVFFAEKNGEVEIEEIQSRASLASVYYIDEYQEYCIHVMEMRRIFLKSGQPLGKDRMYYLPRGTEIIVMENGEHFKLA